MIIINPAKVSVKNNLKKIHRNRKTQHKQKYLEPQGVNLRTTFYLSVSQTGVKKTWLDLMPEGPYKIYEWSVP